MAVVLCGALRVHAQTTPTLAVSLSPSAPEYTDTLTVSATVSGTGTPQPSGTITYSVDGGGSATVSLTRSSTSSIAYFPIAPQTPGAHSVAVSYGGDSNYAAVSAQTTNFTVADRTIQINGSTHGLTPVLYYDKIFSNGQYPGSEGLHGVAVDANLNVYLSYGNDDYPTPIAIGEITNNSLGYRTIPVTGLGIDLSLAVDATGNLYVADPNNARVVKYSTAGVQTNLPIAGLKTPAGVTYDSASGSLFILDSTLGGVIQFNLSSQTPTTVFSGVTGLEPALASDGAGGLYYAVGQQLFFRASDGTVSPIYGEFNGNSTGGMTTAISGLAFDPARKYLWVVAGSGSGVESAVRLDALHHASFVGRTLGVRGEVIAVDQFGTAYTADTVFTNDPVAANAGSDFALVLATSGEEASAVLQLPYGHAGAVGSNPTTPGIYNSVIEASSAIPGNGVIGGDAPGIGPTSWSAAASFQDGTRIKFSAYGIGYDNWMVSDPGTIVPLTTTPFGQPAGIAYASEAFIENISVYISDQSNNTVTSIFYGTGPTYGTGNGGSTGTSQITTRQTTLGFTGLVSPSQLAADGANDVWVLDQGAASGGTRVVRLDHSGTQTTPYSADTGDPLGLIQSVSAFTVDGPQSLYLGGSQNGNGVIVKIDPLGMETRLASGIGLPAAMAVSTAGSVYTVDASTGTLLKINQFGNKTTIATGLPAANELSLDAAGNVYLSSATGTSVVTIAPDGTQRQLTMAGIANPALALADDVGTIYVIDGNTKNASLDYRWQVNAVFGVVGLSTPATQAYLVSNVGNIPLGALTMGISPSGPFSAMPGASNGCQFAGSGSPTILQPAQSCDVQFQFAPTAAGADTAMATLTSAGTFIGFDNLQYAFWNLSGVGSATASAPMPVLTPPALDFGSVTVGATSSAETATLSNSGNAALTVSGIAVTGTNAASFAETNNCGASVAASASCMVSVTCTPPTAGALTATLVANYPSPLPQQTVALTCNGTAVTTPQAALTPATANFGSVTTGTTSSAQAFTLKNAGNASLSITSIALGGTNAGSFAIATKTCGASLAAGASCAISVTFSPTAAGSFTASLSVVDAVGTQTASLAGSGTAPAAPQAALTPASANFGSVTVGAAGGSTAFTLTNAGNAALPITTISVTGANASSFTISSKTCGSSLNASASCTIEVAFDPFSAGNLSAMLSVADSLGTQTSSLSGTGIASIPADFTIAATPSAQSTYRGTSVLYTVNLTSTTADNPFTDSVTLSAGGLPSGARVSFSPAGAVPGTTKPAASTMTVEVPALSASRSGAPPGAIPAGVSLACLGCAWLLRRKLKGVALCVLVVLLTGTAATSLMGCSSSTTGFAVPTSTSTITITGTSGSTVHSTTVTLTVK